MSRPAGRLCATLSGIRNLITAPRLALLGLINLAFLAGALVMHSGVPPADFLAKAFNGTRAWGQRLAGAADEANAGTDRPARAKLVTHKVEKAYQGLTLYTTEEDTRATLVDMQGTVVREWSVPSQREYWFRVHLYPGGELLAVTHRKGGATPYGGDLIKLDKDSKVLWRYPAYAHHDVAVGEGGDVYVLTQGTSTELPGFENVPANHLYLTDHLVRLSPTGRELQKISLLDAFRDSPYAFLLGRDGNVDPKAAEDRQFGDVLHANSVEVLGRNLAAKFPQFRAGHVLTSLRNQDIVAMIDPQSRAVTWAARGPWARQHDPEFLPDGKLLIYDNLGPLRDLLGTGEGFARDLARAGKRSRVIEFDPATLGVTWVYEGDGVTPFFNETRGMKQRLANGNTLITDPGGRRLLEVTREKETVWEYLPARRSSKGHITGARRYAVDELPFLNLKGPSAPKP